MALHPFTSLHSDPTAVFGIFTNIADVSHVYLEKTFRATAGIANSTAVRLFGAPMQSVDLAIDEMRYAREKLGMRGGFLRPNPYDGNRMISDPMYEPFWTMAEELDFSIGFHEGSTTAMPTVGVDRFEADRAARHMISHTMEIMLAAMAVIGGGVVDHHPRLRIAFLGRDLCACDPLLGPRVAADDRRRFDKRAGGSGCGRCRDRRRVARVFSMRIFGAIDEAGWKIVALLRRARRRIDRVTVVGSRLESPNNSHMVGQRV